jgi:hypothetical protein
MPPKFVLTFSRKSSADRTSYEASIPCPSLIVRRSSQPNLCVHTSQTPLRVVSPWVLVRLNPSGNRSGVPCLGLKALRLCCWLGPHMPAGSAIEPLDRSHRLAPFEVFTTAASTEL